MNSVANGHVLGRHQTAEERAYAEALAHQKRERDMQARVTALQLAASVAGEGDADAVLRAAQSFLAFIQGSDSPAH